MKIQYFIIALLIFIFFGIMRSCHNRELHKLQDENSLLLIDKQKNDSIINKNNKIILTQEVKILNNEQSLKQYSDSIFQLKRKNEKDIKSVHSYYKNVIKVTIDTFIIPYIDTLYIDNSDSIYFETIIVPKKFAIKTSNYDIGGTVKKEGVEISKLEMEDSIYGRFVTEKGGLFKKDKIKYQTFNTNPYVHIESTTSAVYKKPKKKFIHHVIEKSIYIGIGILITKQL